MAKNRWTSFMDVALVEFWELLTPKVAKFWEPLIRTMLLSFDFMNIKNYQDIFMIIFLFYFFSGPGNKKNKKNKEDPSLVSQSLIYQAGETSNLPCDISVPKNHAPNDELMLIMWYREDVRSPIYSIGMFFFFLCPIFVGSSLIHFKILWMWFREEIFKNCF